MSERRPMIETLLVKPREAEEEVRKILLAVDREFQPPLSLRSGPLEGNIAHDR